MDSETRVKLEDKKATNRSLLATGIATGVYFATLYLLRWFEKKMNI